MAEERPRWREDFPVRWDEDHYMTRRELAKFLTLGSGLLASNVVPRYDLTPDDQRLVMTRLSAINQAPGAGQLVVVENWFTELRSKMAKK